MGREACQASPPAKGKKNAVESELSTDSSTLLVRALSDGVSDLQSRNP